MSQSQIPSLVPRIANSYRSRASPSRRLIFSRAINARATSTNTPIPVTPMNAQPFTSSHHSRIPGSGTSRSNTAPDAKIHTPATTT